MTSCDTRTMVATTCSHCARDRGGSAVPAGAVAGLDLGMQVGEVEVPRTGGPSGAAHSDSCVTVFIEIAADLESQWEIITDVPAGATWFSPCVRLPNILSSVRAAAGDKMWRSRGNFCSVHSWFCGRRASVLQLSDCKGSERQKDSKAFGSQRGCGPSSEPSESGPSPGHHARPHGMICWQAGRPRSRFFAPIPTPCSSGPVMLGKHAVSRKWRAKHCKKLALCFEAAPASHPTHR